MGHESSEFERLSNKDLAALLVDMVHRLIVHHGFWLREVEHQLGPEKGLAILAAAWERSQEVQMRRLARVLGFEVEDGIPRPLLDLERRRLVELITAIAQNWLANDGVWFQAVEFSQGMNDAKRCNDSCWARFSPFEAWSIKRLLHLGPRPGLEGLQRALGLRLYALINRQRIVAHGPHCIEFQMVDCRVQSARRRKGLADYPCKSAGLVEYPYFARAIDPRIVTECVGCPPDPHPEEWFCAWRFTLTADRQGEDESGG